MASIRRALGEKLFNFEAPEGAGDEGDPHSWDDPDKPSLFARILPTDNPKQKTIAMMVLISLGGLGIYLLQFFPTGQVVAVTALLAGYPAVAYLARKSAWSKISQLDWSILTNGKWTVVRYGKAHDSESADPYEQSFDDDGIQFEVGQSLALGGRMEPLEVRDLFGDPAKLGAKTHRTGETGDTPARDYLPGKFTASAETDTLGSVYVTLTDGLEKQASAPDIDRAATLPSILPRSQVGDVKRTIAEYAEIHLPAAERRADMFERRFKELDQPAQEQVKDYLDDLLRLMAATGMGARQAAQQLTGADGQAASIDTDQGVAGGLPGDMPGQDALEEIDERVDEAMEEEA